SRYLTSASPVEDEWGSKRLSTGQLPTPAAWDRRCEDRHSSSGVKAICCLTSSPGTAGVSPVAAIQARETRAVRGQGLGGHLPPRPSECEPDPEHLHRIERKFRIKAPLDVVGLTETVLLAREQEVANGISIAPQRLDHDLGLVRRHHGVLGP